jgi:ATP-dependent DNA ligase
MGESLREDENGRCAFNALQHKQPRGHIQLYAFDILVHRGRNVLRLPIEERRELLSEAASSTPRPKHNISATLSRKAAVPVEFRFISPEATVGQFPYG